MRNLDQEQWPFVDATLQQFGLPTWSSWNGEKAAYVAESLKEADDDTLVELAKFLGADTPSTVSAPEVEEAVQALSFDFDIFISHLSEHQELAGQIQTALWRYGISSFVAHADIVPTSAWQDELEKSLRTCDALVALLHPGFHASKWCDQEIGFVMGREKPAFAVTFGEAPYGFIGRFQAFKGVQNGIARPAADIAKSLFESMIVHKDAKAQVSRAVLKRFMQSDSFDAAVARLPRVEALQYWDAPMIEALTNALTNNSQIYGEGFKSVPARTKALIARWSSESPPS